MQLSSAHALDPSSLRNTLSDGRTTCTYDDLPELFAVMDASLERAGVAPEDWLVLRCANSVPAAVVLLYLLDRKRAFVLLPPPGGRAEVPGATPVVPPFCRFELIADADGDHPPEGWTFLVERLDASLDSGSTAHEQGIACMVTSGSTATPKLAAFETPRLIGNALGCVERLQFESADRVVIPAPIFHMFGLGVGLLPAVACRASVDLLQDANVLKFLAREKEFQPNVAFFTPNFCESLLRVRKRPRRYRLTASGGDKLSPVLHQRYEARHGTLVRIYGSTEMGVVAAGDPDDPEALRRTTIGRLMPGVHYCSPGKVPARPGCDDGVRRLGFCHQWGFSGYLDSSGGFVSRYAPGDCYDMHDIGRFHAGAYLEVLGRTDHQIKRDGELLAFVEVESALVSIPGVAQAAVFSDGRCARGDTLVACCVLGEVPDLDERAIRAACRTRLPGYAVPDRVVVVNELPLLESGKVDRAALRRQRGSPSSVAPPVDDGGRPAPGGAS